MKKAFDVALKLQEAGLPVFVATNIPKKHISSGSSTLDKYLLGGFPRGKITEIVGWETTGRTTLCLQAAQEIQKNDGIVVIVDSEDCLLMAHKFNLSKERTIFCDFHAVKELLLSKVVDLLIIDSIAAISYEKGYGSKHASLNIKAIVKEIESINNTIRYTNTACIVTNQFRNALNGGVYSYGENYFSRFFSIKLYLTKIANRTKFLADGFRLSIFLKKNKIAMDFEGLEFEMDVIPGEKFLMEVTEIVEMALDKNIIRYNGKNFVFEGITLADKNKNIPIFLMGNVDIFEKIKNKALNTNLPII